MNGVVVLVVVECVVLVVVVVVLAVQPEPFPNPLSPGFPDWFCPQFPEPPPFGTQLLPTAC